MSPTVLGRHERRKVFSKNCSPGSPMNSGDRIVLESATAGNGDRTLLFCSGYTCSRPALSSDQNRTRSTCCRFGDLCLYLPMPWYEQLTASSLTAECMLLRLAALLYYSDRSSYLLPAYIVVLAGMTAVAAIGKLPVEDCLRA